MNVSFYLAAYGKIISTHFSLITDSILTDYPLWLIGRKDTIRNILQILK